MGSLPEVVERLDYPFARRDESVIDYYHGVPITDPYRWLEDTDAEEVSEFVENQRKLTESVLSTCDFREKLRERITDLYDYPKYECPFKKGDKYFFFYNTGLQSQSILYIQDNIEEEAHVLLDPNKLSDDGTIALSIHSLSENAEFLAFGLSYSGSDWVNIKVMQVKDKTLLSDSLSWVKFSSIAWTHDNKGFFYSCYPTPNEYANLDAGTETDINLNHQVYYHFVGTEQSEDVLCWRDFKNPKWLFGTAVTEDGKYLVLSIEEGCDPVNMLFYCNLTALPNGLDGFRGKDDLLPFKKLVDNFEARYDLVANDGTIFTFRTNKNAPRYKLVRVDLNTPCIWIDVIPESTKDVLESAHCVNGGQLLVCYLSDVRYVLQIRELVTGCFLHQLPIDIGSIYAVSGRRIDREIFFGFTSFLTPGIIYQCDLGVLVPELKVFRESILKDFRGADFETKQRPDLFGCAIAQVGVMDMLRFHKFTIGHAWTTDYGCSDDEEAFHWLIKYSPLHNVRRPWECLGGKYGIQYPATMLLTADHDDRVVPLHSLKLLATMQHVLCTSVIDSPQTNPIIARIDTKAGHGSGRPTRKLIDEAADKFSFLTKMLDTSWFDYNS
eukprot:c26907_g1_i5 orf=667-2493(+)